MDVTGLVRVTVAAPTRRVDLALPDRAPVAEMLPGLLRRAALPADDPDTGWVLRRPDGTLVDPAATLAAQHVRDGEVLHLVPGTLVWPEMEYDDLVDAIAGAAREGRRWGPRHTRIAGLAAAVPAVALVLAVTAQAGAGPVALLAAVALLAGGTVLARAGGDSGAGAVLAGLALPLAFAGGELTVGGPVLGGCAAVLVAATAGGIGVADRVPVFVAAAAGALLGGVAAGLVVLGPVTPPGAAAVVAAAVFLFSPLAGPLAARLGRLPAPALPRTAADLVRDDPQPARSAVREAVIRSDALLTGMLWGGALTASVAAIVAAAGRGVSTVLLLAVIASGLGVRARIHPTVRHRLPLLIAAGTTASALAWRLPHPPALAAPALLVLAALAVAAGLTYSRRPPGAALGRYAEILEILLVLACVPVLCAVLGLYGLVRGLAG
ncbi:type VII secretion integral membrane protein EccD [Actinoplanes sp. NPDC049265]|uniref:type VII secretion integral membrane protein EccD n=1 Tax=Actinoplanes sp. NPDC049265 TaxID=3363902 RepID=UPI003710469B